MPLEHRDIADNVSHVSPSVYSSKLAAIPHASPLVRHSGGSEVTLSGNSGQSSQSRDPVTPAPINDNIEHDLKLIQKITGKF